MTYRLTVRRGPHVAREKFEDLDEAIAAMERRVKDIRSEGPLEAKKIFREYEPEHPGRRPRGDLDRRLPALRA